MASFQDAASAVGSRLLDAIGKGPGFVTVAVLEITLAFTLAVQAKELSGFVAALGVVNAALYGGGAFKAHSDNKLAANGVTNGNVSH